MVSMGTRTIGSVIRLGQDCCRQVDWQRSVVSSVSVGIAMKMVGRPGSEGETNLPKVVQFVSFRKRYGFEPHFFL